jgi:hypothetical protein
MTLPARTALSSGLIVNDRANEDIIDILKTTLLYLEATETLRKAIPAE